MTLIVMVRHGESQSNANADFRTPDVSQIELTSLGWRQAAALAKTPLLPKPDKIVISPYKRAQQTAQFFLAKYPNVTPTVLPIHEYTYIYAPNSTASERHAKVSKYWTDCDPQFHDENIAESFAEFIERVENFLTFCTGVHGTLVAFTHGQFMKAVAYQLRHNNPLPTHDTMKAFRDFMKEKEVDNGGLLFWSLKDLKDWYLTNFINLHLGNL